MKNELNCLLRVDKSGIKQASAALSSAFFNYPLMEYLFPDEIERKLGLFSLFEYYLYYSIRYGEVYTISSNFEGVAIWLTSDNYHMGFFRTLRAVPLPVIFRMGSTANERMKGTDGYMDAVHKRLMSPPHWYLGTLGVVPEMQGKGYASKLLNPMLARIDEAGLPCYLETQVEARVSLYEHFGFRAIDKSIIHGTDITNWGMLRDTSTVIATSEATK
jgi:ribosomal protein S18 acetylase RimI-like enzyme